MNAAPPTAASAPSWWRTSAVGFLLLWSIGPLGWAIAGALYRYGSESRPQMVVVLIGLAGQPAFALVWCLLVIANLRLFRSFTFGLLTLHLVCLAAQLLLPQLVGDPAGRAWFEGFLFGQWGLTVVTGVVCLRQLLHPAAAIERIPPR